MVGVVTQSTRRKSKLWDIHELATCFIEGRLVDWRTTYDGAEFSGKGSTSPRARAILGVYALVVSLPDAVMTSSSMTFLGEVHSIVALAVNSAGGTLCLGKAAQCRDSQRPSRFVSSIGRYMVPNVENLLMHAMLSAICHIAPERRPTNIRTDL
jgi:hypothetical protein